MKVKFTDLYKLIDDKSKIFKKINSLIKKSNFVGGGEVKKFENNFKISKGKILCIVSKRD